MNRGRVKATSEDLALTALGEGKALRLPPIPSQKGLFSAMNPEGRDGDEEAPMRTERAWFLSKGEESEVRMEREGVRPVLV